MAKREIVQQTLRRSALLFAIGVAIYAIGSFDLQTLRVLGVLQRIALCSLFATTIFLWNSPRRVIGWIGALLAAYWLMLMLVPVPGYGAGDLSVAGNLAHYVDRVVLGSHNYVGTGTWDPEGVLSTLPALATALFGVLAGWLLRWRVGLGRRCVWMGLVGLGLIVAGLGLSHWMPINKKLWTDSFCLLMAGIDFVTFAVLLWVIDGFKVRRGLGVPLAFGQNALAVYVISEISGALLWSYPRGATLHDRLFLRGFAGHGSAEMSSLLYALATLGAIGCVACLMRWRGWVWKL